MAGNEIYIGKMLERLYGVVDKIDASTQAQIDALHDTADILNNILANTGIQQQQTVFSNAEFSAVSLISSPVSWLRGKALINFVDVTTSTSRAGKVTFIQASSTGSGNITRIDFPNRQSGASAGGDVLKMQMRLDLTGKNSITFNAKTSLANGYTLKIYINGIAALNYFFDNTAAVALTLDVSAYSGFCDIEFIGTNSNDEKSITMQISALKIDGASLFAKDSKLEYIDNRIVSTGTGAGVGVAKYTVTGVGSWNVLQFIGNLDGVNLSIIDNDGNEIKTLAAGMNNINDLSIFDFYIFYEITDPDAYISSVIFRYF